MGNLVDESILAVIGKHAGEEDIFLCYPDNHGNLCFTDSGDVIGWTVDSIDRWCPIERIMSILDGKEE